MPCLDCLSNCDPLISDKCVKYTGADVPSLGIIKGMSLFEIEKIILDKLNTLTGPNIKLDTINTTCTFITDLLFGKSSQPFTIQQFAEIVFEGFCKLDSKIESSPTFNFNTACLTGDLETKDKIIQAIINKVCNIDTRLVTVETSYIKQSDLCAQVKACISTTVPTYKDRMVPYTYIPYAGPLSNFDNTGKGLIATGFDRIFLANGLNLTQDWRGRSPIGAILNVPGTTLDSVVSNPFNNYSSGVKYGTTEESLTVLQMPQHTHTVIDPGHSHNIPHRVDGDSNNGYTVATNGSVDSSIWSTNLSQSNVTIGNSGKGTAHNNIQPSIACLYIVFIP